MAMSWAGWPRDLCSTVAVLTAGSVCWIVLLRACLPLNRIRWILLLAVATAFVLAYLLLGGIFLLVSLTGPSLLLGAGLVALSCLVIPGS